MDDQDRYGSWDDDEDEVEDWSTAAYDAELRALLARHVTISYEANDAWYEVEPAMERARRRRVAAQGFAATVAAALLAFGGLQLLARFGPGASDLVMTGPASEGADPTADESGPEPTFEIGVASSAVAPGDDGDGPDEDGNGPDEAGLPGAEGDDATVDEVTVPGAPPPSGGVPATPPGGSGTASTPAASTTVPATSAGPTTKPSSSATTRPATTTSRPTTTSQPTTTSSATAASSSTTEVPSDLGSIVVAVQGNQVSLVESRPGRGVKVEVHNDGPEKIEITFVDGKAKCEVRAYVRNGQLVTEVTGSGYGEHEEHDD